MVIQAIEPGGLLGQCPGSLELTMPRRYWDNQWLYGMPVVTTQDPNISLELGARLLRPVAQNSALETPFNDLI